MKKRILSVLIALAMVVTVVPVNGTVAFVNEVNESEQIEVTSEAVEEATMDMSEAVEEPQSEVDPTDRAEAIQAAQTETEETDISDDDENVEIEESEIALEEGEVQETCESIVAAGEFLREQMVAREGEITFAMAAESNATPESIDEIFTEAFMHTGDGHEGAYLKQNILFKQVSFGYEPETGLLVFQVKCWYETTTEQEAAVDAKIAEFKTKYSLAGMSDYEKIRSIYDFVCDSVAYDYDRLGNAVPVQNPEDIVADNYIQQTAYAAAVNHMAVCEGYALLFYRLALEYGFDTRFVTGESYGEDHGWDAVQLAGKSYL